MERARGPPLLPVDDQEMLFEGGIVMAEERRLAGTGSSVQEDEGRVGSGRATEPETLGDAPMVTVSMVATLPGMTPPCASLNVGVCTQLAVISSNAKPMPTIMLRRGEGSSRRT